MQQHENVSLGGIKEKHDDSCMCECICVRGMERERKKMKKIKTVGHETDRPKLKERVKLI
jgi:hypothetical protein